MGITHLIGFGMRRSTILTDVTVSSGSSGSGGFTNPSTFVNRNAAIPNGVTVTRLGMKIGGSRTVYLGIVERTSAGNYSVLYSEQFTATGTGAFEYFTLATPQVIPGSGNFYVYIAGNIGGPNVWYYDSVNDAEDLGNTRTSGTFTASEGTPASCPALAYTKETEA